MEKKPFNGPQPNRNNGGQRRGDKNAKDPYMINEQIRAREVRLVGDNVETGVYSIAEALRIADDQGLDLIEISPNAVTETTGVFTALVTWVCPLITATSSWWKEA
mgnify:CR=1 FL=1